MKNKTDFENLKWSRREFLQTIGMGTLAFLIGCRLNDQTFPSQKRKPPNIIVILSDDHGYGALGCQGNWDIPTPHIDSLAQNGVRFTNGYVTAPLCSPTRAGLLTGRCQQRFGHEFNPAPIAVASGTFGLPLDQKTFADYLREAGYATGIVGKWHLGQTPDFYPQRRGFDEFFGFLPGAHKYTNPSKDNRNPIFRGSEIVTEEEYLTSAFTREALSFIERHKDEPFFLYLPFNAIHSPLDAQEKDLEFFTHLKTPKMQKWAAMLKSLDDAVGSVLSKIRETGLEKDTLIFFLGDNGGYPVDDINPNGALRGRKGDMFEGGIRIPYLMQWKGHLLPGMVYDKPVSSLDILPTAVAAVGGIFASNLEGVNLIPYLEGDDPGTPHEKLFWRLGKKSAARVGDWKLVRNGDGTEQLFNLASDIGEENDMASANIEKLEELKSAYNEWDANNIEPKWIDGRQIRQNKRKK